MSNGNVVGKTHYNQNNDLALKISYRFDAENRLTQKIKQTPDGKPIKTLQYSYDPKHLRVQADGIWIVTAMY